MASTGEKLALGAALAVVVGIGAYAVSEQGNPSNPGGGDYSGGGGGTGGDLETTVELAKARIKLMGLVDVTTCNAVQKKVDLDCDGTINSLDLHPWEKDFMDLDADYIIDNFDAHPGKNDWNFDGDSDGIIDAFDQYNNLNDLADNDGDGLLNINDAAPNVPQSQSSVTQDYRRMGENVAYYAQMNEQMKTFLEFDPAANLYDNSYMFEDSDMDGAFDIDDQYAYDANRGGEYDPWKLGTDAFYDDENNGWDSDH